jgi:hypothetical protein
MVQRENIDSGYSNFQLDTRPSGSRGDLDYLLIRRTLSGRGSSARGDDAVYGAGADAEAAIGRPPKHRPACSRSSTKRSGAGTLAPPTSGAAWG